MTSTAFATTCLFAKKNGHGNTSIKPPKRFASRWIDLANSPWPESTGPPLWRINSLPPRLW